MKHWWWKQFIFIAIKNKPNYEKKKVISTEHKSPSQKITGATDNIASTIEHIKSSVERFLRVPEKNKDERQPMRMTNMILPSD